MDFQVVSSESAVSAYENRERETSKFSLHCRVVPWTGAGLEALDYGAVNVHRGSHVTVQLFGISLEGLSFGKEI